MIRLFLVSLHLGLVLAAGSSTTVHTATYTAWRANTFKDTMYLTNTYLPFKTGFSLNLDVGCLKVDDVNYRRDYITLLQAWNVVCTGSWCSSQHDFACPYGNTYNCYNVEHIIDQNTQIPELDRYDKNIVGNLIMAYGKWNQEMGSMTWAHLVAEKSEVYTPAIFDSAYYYVTQCGQLNSVTTSTSSSTTTRTIPTATPTYTVAATIPAADSSSGWDSDNTNLILAAIIAGCIVGVVIFLVGVVFLETRRRQNQGFQPVELPTLNHPEPEV